MRQGGPGNLKIVMSQKSNKKIYKIFKYIFRVLGYYVERSRRPFRVWLKKKKVIIFQPENIGKIKNFYNQ